MASNCPKCNYFLVRCKCAEILLEVENKRLKEELEDYHNAEKFVLGDDCPTDENHCGCVVILKKQIKDQNCIIRKIADALRIEKGKLPKDIDPDYEQAQADRQA